MNTQNLHFYDPLYEVLLFGDIPLKGRLREIFSRNDGVSLKKSISRLIHCPEVSRMHWLNQAGFIPLMFPSGSHTRFAHALGTLHLGNIALDAVTVKLTQGTKTETSSLRTYLNLFGWAEEFIVALFLHDLGHYPFSHVLERNVGLKTALGETFREHEEVACELVLGEGAIYDAYKDRYADMPKRLVADVFASESGYERKIVCYLISGNNKYLEGLSLDRTKMSVLTVMHDLVSGTYDLDRIDHYRRDSFFTGLGHTFKPYVLLHGLHYVCEGDNGTSKEQHSSDAEGQITTLLFIRDQLHKYCFGSVRNISYSAMLNHALNLHLQDKDESARRSEALQILTMTDGELLGYLQASDNAQAKKLTKHIRAAEPLPCIATFPKQNGFSMQQIISKLLEQDKTLVVGFSKYFDKADKPWLSDGTSPPDSGKGYVFGETQTDQAAITLLRSIGIKGAGYPDPETTRDFESWGNV